MTNPTILNPWTARITYSCGHTQDVELPDGREHLWEGERLQRFLDNEVNGLCAACWFPIAEAVQA